MGNDINISEEINMAEKGAIDYEMFPGSGDQMRL
jgi:hypothetical protein